LRQLNLPPASSAVKYKSKRAAIPDGIPDAHVRRAVAAEPELLDPLDALIRRLEADVEDATRRGYPKELALLQSIPGVGPVLSMTVLLEIDTIRRFETRQQFCSYARLIAPPLGSAGKKVGVGCRKQGNAWLKWAFSEAAVLSARKDEAIGRYRQKLKARHGTARAPGVPGHKPGRAVYHMLRHERVFDRERFLRH